MTPSVDDLPPIAVPEEVAAVLRISPGLVYKLVRNGKLRARHAGVKVLIRREWVRQFLEEPDTCRNATEESSSNGANPAAPGKSSGTSEAVAAAARVALRNARKLIKDSSKTSPANGPPAPVIRLKGRSRKSSQAT